MRKPDLEIAQWIFAGVPTIEIAERAGITDESARRIVAGQNRRQIMAHVAKWRDDFVEATAMSLVKAQWQAIMFLIKTLNDKKEATVHRIKAAQLLVERADIQRAVERTSVSADIIIRYIEETGATLSRDKFPQRVLDAEPPPEKPDGSDGNGRP